MRYFSLKAQQAYVELPEQTLSSPASKAGDHSRQS